MGPFGCLSNYIRYNRRITKFRTGGKPYLFSNLIQLLKKCDFISCSLQQLSPSPLYEWHQSSVDPMAFATSPSPPTFNYNQTSVPIFNGEAYDYWSIQMQTLFISQDLWDVIENGYPVPESQEE
ncbi:hypothetical protein D0Y65_050978 [Glycine soja]|uniref:DUF4219 domain-containing protein n=1 Tax=Glycine soja TaxID=3848 RepID=A0A445FE77_GLYSO|nr:hypothetical protein D0Y65_050978 [Glycine soja]